MEQKYLKSFDYARLYYEIHRGKLNKWLIFLHGLGGDLTALNREVSYFHKHGLSTVAIDLRGHGLSERSNKTDFYNIENFPKDVVALIEKENLEEVILIGHCFGGMIATSFAIHHSNSLKGLVLVDTSTKPPFLMYNRFEKAVLKALIKVITTVIPNFHRKGHAHFAQFIGTGDIHLKRFTSDVVHTSLYSYLKIIEKLVNFNSEPDLEKISTPTLIVHGTKDTIFPPKTAYLLNSKIKDSELNMIEEANHIIVLNNPIKLSSVIENYLSKIGFIKSEAEN